MQLENIEILLKVNNTKVKQLEVEKVIRTLGIHICLKLKWEEEYNVIVNKMRELIVKLNNMVIKLCLIYMYFNTYLIKKVFFGYRIIELN